MKVAAPSFTYRVLLEPALDVPGQWTAHNLDLDIISQGNSPEHALAMIREATQLVVEDGAPRTAYTYTRDA